MLAIPSLGDQLPAQLPQPTKHAIEKKNRHLDRQLARPARLGKSNDNIDATNAASKGKERHYAYGDHHHLVSNNPKGRTDFEWPLHFSADLCNSNSHKCTIDGCADGCTDVCSLVSTYATTATTASSVLHSHDSSSPYPLSPSPGFAAFNFATVSAPADLNLIGTQHNRRYHRRNFPLRVFRRLSFHSHLLNCPFLLLLLLLFVVASALGAALPSHVGAIHIDHSAERVGIIVDWPGEFDPPTLDGLIDFSNYSYDESFDSFGDPRTENRGRSDPAYPRFGSSGDSHIDDDPTDMNINSENRAPSTSQSAVSQSFSSSVSAPLSSSSSLSTSVDCRNESAADYYTSLEDIFGRNGSDPNAPHPSSSQVDRASREYSVSVYIGSYRVCLCLHDFSYQCFFTTVLAAHLILCYSLQLYYECDEFNSSYRYLCHYRHFRGKSICSYKRGRKEYQGEDRKSGPIDRKLFQEEFRQHQEP